MSTDDAGAQPKKKRTSRSRDEATETASGAKSAKSPRPRKSAAASGERSTGAGAAQGDKMRLQRALAAAGYGSRRQCEDLIVEGRVMVDGQIMHELGTTVDLGVQKVYVDGTPLKPRRLVYYALHKPVGVVTTNADPEGRPRVIDLVPPDERVFPVGRLDRSSEGLILLTNDGELAQRLAHPRYEIRKVYRVTVAGNVELDTMRQMERGIYIAEGMVRVEGAKLLKTRGRATELEITLKEGKNREIRRILARLGHKVQQLKRIAIGPLRLGEMPSGAYRKLTFEELKKLRAAVAYAGTDADGDEQESGSVRPPKKGPMRAHRGGAGKPKRKATERPLGTADRAGSSRPVPNRNGARPGSAARVPGARKGANRRPQPKGREEFVIEAREVKGSVIGADPPVRDERGREERARGVKPHVVRPRTAAPKKATAGKRPARPGKRPPQAGKTAGPLAKGRKLKGQTDLGRPTGAGDKPRNTKKRSGAPKRSRPS